MAAGDNRKQLGTRGEAIVQAHLERLGWRVLARNFRCALGEMDLIAQEPDSEGGTLVFLEVKTRRGSDHGSPIEAVDVRKQSRLAGVAQAYLAERNVGGEEPACRFDIAEVFFGPDGLARVSLRRAAFSANE